MKNGRAYSSVGSFFYENGIKQKWKKYIDFGKEKVYNVFVESYFKKN